MLTFFEWLQRITEARRESLVDPSTLRAYDAEFQRALRDLIQRTQDPVLRAKFHDMIDCQVRDARGHCRSFSEYITATLVKNGVHHQYDIEACLTYVVEKMLVPTTPTGEPRSTLFGGFDEAQPYNPSFNPLQARFMKFLTYAIRNIRKGKIPRLSTVERRPTGSVSIGQGRDRDDTIGTISPDEIAARPSDDADFSELVADITDLLKQKEPAYGLPLSGLFAAMIAGKNSEQQRREFGDRTARAARPVVVRIIGDYAQSSGNYHLLALVDRFQDFHSNQSLPPGRQVRKPQKTVQPVLTTKEKDYASIISVLDRFQGQPVGTAQLGSYRRRWYSYEPRTPGSSYRNRLEETLALMVADGVLRAIKGSQGATLYVPGPHYDQYRQAA